MKSIITSAALLATTVSAKHFYGLHPGKEGAGKAFLVNRCSYPVHLWSISKELGCQDDERITLQPGDDYTEGMREGDVKPGGDDGGISIKISKTKTCTKGSLTQWEYKLSYKEKYEGNFLDMSFVDCYGDLDACPGRTDGFYMKAGNQVGGITKSAVNNEHCPVFSVANAEAAAKVSYLLPDDEQTKWCPTDQDMQLYLCGGQLPGDEDDSAPSSPAAPSHQIESSSAQPSSSSSSSSKEAASSTSEEANFVVAAAAAITEAPVPAPVAPVIKTEVVYVTEYVKARHAHGRRHQRFHA